MTITSKESYDSQSLGVLRNDGAGNMIIPTKNRNPSRVDRLDWRLDLTTSPRTVGGPPLASLPDQAQGARLRRARFLGLTGLMSRAGGMFERAPASLRRLRDGCYGQPSARPRVGHYSTMIFSCPWMSSYACVVKAPWVLAAHISPRANSSSASTPSRADVRESRRRRTRFVACFVFGGCSGYRAAMTTLATQRLNLLPPSPPGSAWEGDGGERDAHDGTIQSFQSELAGKSFPPSCIHSRLLTPPSDPFTQPLSHITSVTYHISHSGSLD